MTRALRAVGVAGSATNQLRRIGSSFEGILLAHARMEVMVKASVAAM